MFLEICMQIHSVVFALSRQINKQNVCENNNLLCAGNKIFVKYQAQGFFNPNPPLAYALGLAIAHAQAPKSARVKERKNRSISGVTKGKKEGTSFPGVTF